jgi:hypothetical protein
LCARPKGFLAEAGKGDTVKTVVLVGGVAGALVGLGALANAGLLCVRLQLRGLLARAPLG